jgi:hypothetical protein
MRENQCESGVLLLLGLAMLGHAALADGYGIATHMGAEETPPNESKGYGFAAIAPMDAGHLLIDFSSLR